MNKGSPNKNNLNQKSASKGNDVDKVSSEKNKNKMAELGENSKSSKNKSSSDSFGKKPSSKNC